MNCPNCQTPLTISLAPTPPKSSEPKKVITPASDSVKGERDRHGRTIIARNDYAMVVECGVDDFDIASECGRYRFDEKRGRWDSDQRHWIGNLRTSEDCIPILARAARTPLPTANPAASAKGEGTPIADFMKAAGHSDNNTETRLHGATSNIANIYGLIDNEFRPAIATLTQRLKDRDKDVLTLTGQINDLATKLNTLDKNYRELSQQLLALNKQVALKL